VRRDLDDVLSGVGLRAGEGGEERPVEQLAGGGIPKPDETGGAGSAPVDPALRRQELVDKLEGARPGDPEDGEGAETDAVASTDEG